MDFSSIDPKALEILERLVVPGTVVGSFFGFAAGVRLGGGWSALAELARAVLPWNKG